MEKENIRFYIQMRFMLGSDARSIHNDFVAVLTDNAPGYSTVARWIQHFKQGRENLKNEQRIGRPITEKTAVNIERVRQVIQHNPYSTFGEIEAETFLSPGTIQTIIHDCLEMKKSTSRWVPHSLSDKNRQDRVRVCQENLAKFKDAEWRLCDIITGDESWFYWCQVKVLKDPIDLGLKRWLVYFLELVELSTSNIGIKATQLLRNHTLRIA